MASIFFADTNLEDDSTNFVDDGSSILMRSGFEDMAWTARNIMGLPRSPTLQTLNNDPSVGAPHTVDVGHTWPEPTAQVPDAAFLGVDFTPAIWNTNIQNGIHENADLHWQTMGYEHGFAFMADPAAAPVNAHGVDTTVAAGEYDHGLAVMADSPAAAVNIHGIDTTAAGAHVCLCSKSYTRRDSLRRHVRAASHRASRAVLESGASVPGGLFPCTFCNKHGGNNGFIRRDHLRQHLGEKGMHKLDREAVERYFMTHH